MTKVEVGQSSGKQRQRDGKGRRAEALTVRQSLHLIDITVAAAAAPLLSSSD